MGIYPNRVAARRLVDAALAGQRDEWAEGRSCLTFADEPDAANLSAGDILEAAA